MHIWLKFAAVVNPLFQHTQKSAEYGQARVCDVGGLKCAVLLQSLDDEDESEVQELTREIELIESLPVHPNVIRYLFHDIVDNQVRVIPSSKNGRE